MPDITLFNRTFEIPDQAGEYPIKKKSLKDNTENFSQLLKIDA